MALAFLLAPSESDAQYLTRPQIPWRTFNTARFDIHFPAEMEEWTRRVAARMEVYADAVNAMVGNAPTARVTVIVEDPSNIANGFALPFMEGPVIFLWPTPPSPSPTFGAHRGWGEALAVHEYGHIAHLTFPSRNARERLLWRFLPTKLSPVAIKAPAWVIEGYATLIEGRITGSGRPFSAGRAAVLRQWALEGKLPTYAQLNGSGAFLGGNMRYLAGSAFLEWLEQRRGDSSLVYLWRRMSARQQRTFDESFAGVFGASAPDLYGAFTVDVTEQALQIRNRLRVAGLVEGELIQRLSGGTGEPALSPDGSRLAIVLRRLNGPSRLVVWSTRPESDSALRLARDRLLARDSLDVLPFDSFPRPRRVIASLRPANGRSHESPRWMPDGVSMLVSRDEPAPNGVRRPDLFLWNTSTRSLRRVTRGAGIRQADPSPDGRDAVGVRCHGGVCSVVMVTLDTGAWRLLVAGHPDLVWHRPRFSPDGARIAVSFQENGHWGIALVDARTGDVRRIPGEGVTTRHSPSFTPTGSELVAVSERSGISNLEILSLDGSSSRSLTRVTGAVLGPDVSRTDGSVWFLTLRSGGYDVRRLPGLAGVVADDVVSIHGGLAPAAPPTPVAAAVDTAARHGTETRAYGLGPRRWRVLPGGAAGADGSLLTLMLANIDPIGRLSVVSQAGYGSQGTWRGASVAAALKRTAVGLEASAWALEHEPSRSADHFAPTSTDIRSRGMGALARAAGEGSQTAYVVRAGFSVGQVSNAVLSRAGRWSTLGEARARLSVPLGPATVVGVGGIAAAVGETNRESWQRTIVNGSLTLGTARRWLRAEWVRGAVTAAGPDAPGRASEQFVVGGAANPFLDATFLSQRIAVPAVPAGLVGGRTFQTVRVALGGLAWEPYVQWLAAGDSLTSVKRIAGFERTFAITSLGFARLPGVRARGGVAYSFDEPFQSRTRAYLSLSYTP